MTVALTPRQHQTMRFLRRHYTEKGYAPTAVEIGAELGLRSKSNVVRILGELETKGAIKRQHGRARSIELTEYSRAPGSVTEALDVAREHLLYALNNGMTAEQALYDILGRPVPSNDLNLAILEVAKAWERLRETN